nr:Dihydrofolate reductase [uncultured bacterium]AIA13348.1 Dihydrofolate reductase [uncultured bacterium]
MKVFIIAAMTADGFIAKNEHQHIDWTSKEDKKFFVDMTKESGVMVMGGNTYRTFKKPLPGRRHIVYTHGEVEGEAFEKTLEPPKDLVKRLRSEGYDNIAVIGGSSIYSMFLKAGVLTDIYLTVEPLFFGKGIKLLSDEFGGVELKLNNVKKINDNTILIHYEV